jgi:hypothetical protein
MQVYTKIIKKVHEHHYSADSLFIPSELKVTVETLHALASEFEQFCIAHEKSKEIPLQA